MSTATVKTSAIYNIHFWLYFVKVDGSNSLSCRVNFKLCTFELTVLIDALIENVTIYIYPLSD